MAEAEEKAPPKRFRFQAASSYDAFEAMVEKIAINAVMAGCLPEHMPVLIAAVQALSDPHIEWRYLKYGNQLVPERVVPPWKWLYDAPDDTLLPTAAGPHWFHIVVVGGSIGKSSCLTGIGEPVTVEIMK